MKDVVIYLSNGSVFKILENVKCEKISERVYRITKNGKETRYDLGDQLIEIKNSKKKD